jgi:hypothetical protein
MNSTIQKALDSLFPVFEKTEETLSEWTGAGNLQFPVLLTSLASKLNWDDDQVRRLDPIVRYYVRVHPEWCVTRGAHGGIMRLSDKKKKEDAKAVKSTVKDQVKAAIDAKIAEAASRVATSSTTEDKVLDTEADSDFEDDTDFSEI